jgi:soluble lytic murein transglycosylase-like protein
VIPKTPKTIRDYWPGQEGRSTLTTQRVSDTDAFRRMMHAALQRHRPSSNRKGHHLTIRDYWQQAFPMNQRMRPSLSNTTETKSSPAPAPPSTASGASGQPSAASLDLNKQNPKALVRHQIERAAQQAARQYGLPAGLVQSVIRHESNYNPQAVSPAGAQGLMQLMPATARELGVADPFDIQQNIDGGSRYLRKMLDCFDGNLHKALAAYNAGPGTVRRYGDVPPYPETRAYIRRVLSSAGTLT